MGHVGRTRDGSKRRYGKGLNIVCIAPRCTNARGYIMQQNYVGPYKFDMQAQEHGHHSNKKLQYIKH